jgi:hypothetical protein
VEATEPGARVLVDGRERGRAPLALRLPVGRHAVRVLSDDGNRIHEEPRVLVSARPALVRARLVPRLGRVKLAVRPPGAQVFADGRAVDARRPLPLPAGAHRLKARAPGHEEGVREVTVEPDRLVEIELSLRPLPPPRPWYLRRRTWGWVSLGASGASIVAGLLSARAGQSSVNELRRRERDGTLDFDRYRALASDADSKALLANVLFGVSAAAAATGLVLLVVGDDPPPPATGWRVVPAAGGLAIARRF